MKSKKIVHIKTCIWQVADVYTIRDFRGYPVKLVLSLSTEGFDYRKKMVLTLEEVQNLFGFMIDIQNPRKGLIGSSIKINEIANVI